MGLITKFFFSPVEKLTAFRENIVAKSGNRVASQSSAIFKRISQQIPRFVK